MTARWIRFGLAVLCLWIGSHPSIFADGQAATDPPTSPGDEYVLGAEDVLLISVWEEPDFTMSVIVRPDGKISLPLLGDISAAGLTANELAADVRQALTHYVREPIVVVLVQEIRSFKVYVLGKVASQGALELKVRTSFLQAIALAGGFNTFANRSSILLIRNVGGDEVRMNLDYKKIISGQQPEMNIYVERGDIIVVD